MTEETEATGRRIPRDNPRNVEYVERQLQELRGTVAEQSRRISELTGDVNRLNRMTADFQNYTERTGVRDMGTRALAAFPEVMEWWLQRKEQIEKEEHYWRRSTQRANVVQGIMAVCVFALAVADFFRTIKGK